MRSDLETDVEELGMQGAGGRQVRAMALGLVAQWAGGHGLTGDPRNQEECLFKLSFQTTGS